MPGTTASVPAPNFQTTGSIGVDQLGVGATPGTQRAHIKSTTNEVSLLVEQTAVSPTSDVMQISSNATTDVALGVRLPADTNSRFKTTTGGVLSWGTGTATQDTNLYRSATNTLKTDNSLSVGTNLTVTGTTTVANVSLPGTTYLPADQGFVTWTYDPAMAANGTNTISGTVYLARVILRYSATVSKVMLSIASGAATVTANQNFVGIYDSTGTRQAVTAAGSIDSALTSAGVLTATLSTTPTLAAGMYWVAFVNNATTPAQLGRASALASTPNANLTNANYRFAVNGTSQTSLPASITPASNTVTNSFSMWAAVL